MNKRNSISITLKGPSQVYYAHMFNDTKLAVKLSITDNAGVMPVITDAHILRYIIGDYFILKYGHEERKKLRSVFFAKDFEDIEQNQKMMDIKYRKELPDA